MNEKQKTLQIEQISLCMFVFVCCQGKSTRKTLTKTRKFVVDGVVMTSQTSRIVADEMKKQQQHELWSVSCLS